MVLKKQAGDLEVIGMFHLVGAHGVYRDKPPSYYKYCFIPMVQLLSIFPGMLFGRICVKQLYTSHFLDSCAQQIQQQGGTQQK